MSNLSERVAEVLRILSKAECKEIAGRRCFVVGQEEFFTVIEFVIELNPTDPDVRISAEGYNNAQIALSPADKERYYVATKADLVLDALWRGEKK